MPDKRQCDRLFVMDYSQVQLERSFPRQNPLGSGSVSGPERKRGQTQIVAAAQGRPLAQDAACPMRLGRHQEEGQLLQGAIQSPQGQARPEESDLCGGRLNAYGDLPHA